MTSRRLLTAGLIVVGLGLVGVGASWSYLVPPSAYWTTDQAKEYVAAQAEMHAKSHHHEGRTGQEQEMAAARERFITISQQLERARGTQKRFATLFLASGGLLLVAGIVLHFTQPRSE